MFVPFPSCLECIISLIVERRVAIRTAAILMAILMIMAMLRRSLFRPSLLNTPHTVMTMNIRDTTIKGMITVTTIMVIVTDTVIATMMMITITGTITDTGTIMDMDMSMGMDIVTTTITVMEDMVMIYPDQGQWWLRILLLMVSSISLIQYEPANMILLQSLRDREYRRILWCLWRMVWR